ncbi:hypothetical protein K501DRAFT_273028, partial [Backusella circina FSU 941]
NSVDLNAVLTILTPHCENSCVQEIGSCFCSLFLTFYRYELAVCELIKSTISLCYFMTKNESRLVIMAPHISSVVFLSQKGAIEASCTIVLTSAFICEWLFGFSRIFYLNYSDKLMTVLSVGATIVTGLHVGNTVLISKVEIFSDEFNSPVAFKRFQFPVQFAFYMTIKHSTDKLYIAFSRAKQASDIRIITDKNVSTFTN